MVTDLSLLVAQIYKARYFSNSSFLNFNLETNPRYTWRSIWNTRDLLQKHSRIRVGNGANIRVMMDLWLSTQDYGFITTPLGLEYENV